MKKLLGLILVVCLMLTCGISLMACGEQADTTLYHLTLSYSENVSANESFKQEDLKATYAYGCKGTTVSQGTRDEDEVAELLKAGATQENIDKAGVRQNDGSYWFFDQDPMYLEAPKVEGYKFLGFFEKGSDSQQPTFNPMITDIDGEQGLSRWNMFDKDVELVAKYEVLTYKVTYCDANGVISNPTNPTNYDASVKLNVELLDPIVPEGYEFKYWYYNKIVFDANGNNTQEPVQCTKLPTDYEDGELVLFAEFEKIKCEVTINFDPLISEKTVDDTLITETQFTAEYEYGTDLDIWVKDYDGNYSFGGFYVGNEKIESERRFTYTVEGDVTIDAKLLVDFVYKIYVQYPQEQGGKAMFDGYYYEVAETDLIPKGMSLYDCGEYGETIDKTQYATDNIATANELAGQGDIYQINATYSDLVIDSLTPEDKTIIIVYSFKS